MVPHVDHCIFFDASSDIVRATVLVPSDAANRLKSLNHATRTTVPLGEHAEVSPNQKALATVAHALKAPADLACVLVISIAASKELRTTHERAAPAAPGCVVSGAVPWALAALGNWMLFRRLVRRPPNLHGAQERGLVHSSLGLRRARDRGDVDRRSHRCGRRRGRCRARLCASAELPLCL